MNGKLLTECGIEYEEGLEKFLQSKELYEGLLKDFVKENSFEAAKKAMEQGDYEEVLKTIHAMKSVTGTLCMNKLYEKCCQTVDCVRSEDFTAAMENFSQAYAMYQRIVEGILNA